MVPWDNPSFQDIKNNDKDRKKCQEDGGTCIDNGTSVGINSANTMAFAIKQAVGCMSPEDPEDCTQEKISNSAMGNIAYVMSSLYSNPPASSVYYAKYMLDKAGIVQPAYAQGIGFVGMLPFLPFWQAMRNISFSILILIMIVIGFMIIFRVKIDPKTIISIQAAVPKIIVTLILIYFSYPIVGLFIDLMYVVTAMGISIMVQGMGGAIGSQDMAQIQTQYLNSNVGDLFAGTFWPMGHILSTFGKNIGTSVGGSGLGGGIGLLVSLFTKTAATTILSTSFLSPILLGVVLPSLIFVFIIVLGLLFTFIRLLLLLVNSYIQLVINLILAPIILLQEAVPGKSAFGQWIKNIMANLIVFPATIVILMFSVYLSSQGQGDTPGFSPPLLGSLMAGKTFHAILGLGVIFLAPQLVAQIKKAFSPKPMLPITAGTALAPLTGGIQTSMGAASQFYYLQNMPGIKGIMQKFGGGGGGGNTHG